MSPSRKATIARGRSARPRSAPADGGPPGGLQQITWSRFMRGPDASLLNDLYVPALSRAIRYDRCCAYFTSRVLSVAARGFGGLIQNLLAAGHALPKPAARLLVNEQLDPDDLEALLATGDQSALIEKLLKQFKTPRDALEKSRLQMLAWLVASGWLEVRVALMRHTRGIAHAKFGLFTDPAGDAIAFSGSDNETGEALSENYEELTLGTSWQDPDFVAYYGSRFDTLWQDRDEAVTSVALPDAVRLKLVQTAPKTPPSEPVADSLSLQAAMLWHFLAAAPYMPNGEHVCDATAFVELWPHQRRVVEDTSRAFPAGRLLCDEVGMGKTIEAILVLRRLLAGRGVARALLLVPAGLLKQWQDELREKGGLLVPRWESGLLLQPDGAKPSKMEAVEAFSTQPLLLVSREWVRLEGNRQLILAAPAWDLVLLDEAHAARRKESVVTEFNSGNLLLQLIRELQLRRRTRGIILLSATPMQTQPWEPWDLLTVLGVGGDWAVEFADIDTFYRGVARAEQGRLDHATAQSVARLAGADPAFPPLPGVAGNGNLAQVLTFALPDEQRTYAGWLRKGAPLTRRMHRNTKDTLRSYYQRGLLPLPPPQRNVDDVVFDYHDHAERQVYDAIETYINQRYEQLETEKPGKGFVMTVYRRRAASSPQALRESLHRRLDGLERVLKKQHAADWFTAEEIGVDPRDLGDADLDEKIDAALPRTPQAAAAEKSELVSLLNALESLGNTDTKFERFWEVLHAITADGRAVLVFTEYTDTLEYLRELLRPTYGTTLACYSGDGGLTWSGQGWRAVAKPEITARLAAGEIKVLLCTDAASEGLNLQSAGALINYDLPWNPSKVEQRIGRIDRIGQAQPTVPVRNLFLSASVDMLVYNALRQRCGLFERFVGQMQPIIAVARDALRRNLRREAVGPLIQQIAALADQLGSNPAAASAYVSSDTDGAAPPPSFITRSDLASALDMLARLQSGPVRASRTRYAARWTIRGIGRRSVDVTTSREELERDATVIPATLSGSLAPAIAGKLPMPASRVPLVTAEHSIGAFRCVEARWVSPNDSQPVNSLSQLRGLIAGWDGAGPPLSAVVKAQAEARETARQRAEAAASAARKAEEDGIEQQLLAARKRLLRELGRTLRCHGPGDLGAAFRARLQQESRADGRYHQALSLLGTYPAWDADETNQIDAFAASLGTHARQARLAGSEIDAALHDPRWLAADS